MLFFHTHNDGLAEDVCFKEELRKAGLQIHIKLGQLSDAERNSKPKSQHETRWQ